VDGGSEDGSIEIIERYARRFPDRLTWWVSEKDQGQTDAINKGFARAKGEILAWLNSDDTYQPDAVSEAVAFLQAHQDVGMVYGDAHLVDADGQLLGRFPARQTDYRRLLRGYVHIPQQAAFFRADLWRRVGPLDPILLRHGLRFVGAAGASQAALPSSPVGQFSPAPLWQVDICR
jgi:glycosyltransferase involved in cell wall biosynthesis